nr:hypothetical protein [Allomuricauda sp.]
MHLYYANIIGSLVLILAIALYFKEKREKSNSFSKRYNLLFWVSLGLFVFYIFFPFILLVGYIRYDLYAEYHFRTVLLALILFMYGCFNIGLLIGKRRAFG